MKDYIDVDPIPYNEEFPKGTSSFEQRQLARTYREQLKREFPNWEGLVEFRVVSCGHDLGEYAQIRIVFDNSNEQSVELAYHIDGASSPNWDLESRLELGLDNILRI